MAEISNLVLHAKCNDNAADTVVTDATATQNGTMVGGNTDTKTIAGKIDLGFDLDGTGDYLEFADHVAYNWTTELSVFMWVKLDNGLINDTYFDKYYHTGNDREILFKSATTGYEKLEMYIGDPADGTLEAQLKTDNNVLSEGSWLWIGFVYNAGALEIFVDNVSVPYTVYNGAIPSSLYNDTRPIKFFSAQVGGLQPDGKLDDCRVYLHALTSAERAILWNSGNGTESNNIVSGSLITWEPEFQVINGGFDL